MNDRSPGYEPDGISWLPHLAMFITKRVYYKMFWHESMTVLAQCPQSAQIDDLWFPLAVLRSEEASSREIEQSLAVLGLVRFLAVH